MLFLISRINLNTKVFIQEITIFKGDYSNLKDFKKCTDTAGSSIWKLWEWMEGYKGWESNLDKCLSPLNTLLMTELPSSFHKIGV